MPEQSNEVTSAQPGNGKAVGTSVLAAGAAGLIGAIFMGRQSREERVRDEVERRVKRLESDANDAVTRLNRAIEGFSFDGSGTSRAARKKARRLSKSATSAADEAVKRARKRVAEIDKEVRNLQLAENANRLATDGSDRAAALSATLNERITGLIEASRAGAASVGGKASAGAAAVAGQSAAQAERARAKVEPVRTEAERLAHDVKVRGSGLASQGASLVSDVRQKSPELLEKARLATQDATGHARDLTPEIREKLTDVAHKAAERGSDVVARAMERAPEVAERVKERAPEVLGAVTTTTHELQEQAKPLIAEAGHAAVKAAEGARSLARDAGKTVIPGVQHQAETLGERVSTTTHAIETKSRHAASAAGQGSKDAGALAIWTAAAAGVAYLAFLNEDQRARVKESAKRVWTEARAVYHDIRGYDEEFK